VARIGRFVLALFERVFQPESDQRTPTTIAVSSDVQPVADLARWAERSASPYRQSGGYHLVSLVLTRAGAGSDNGYIDVLDELRTGWDPVLRGQDDIDVWLAAWWAETTASPANTTVTNCSLSEEWSSGGSATRIPVPLSQAETTDFKTAYDLSGIRYVCFKGDKFNGMTDQYIYVRPGTRIYGYCTLASAGVVTWYFRVWVGPKGAVPPGMM